jgi:hypothetical protein
MMTALSGIATSAQSLVTSMSTTPTSSAASNQAAANVNRATAPDTVTISAAGQQASQASQDVDSDGDSH